MIYKDTKSYMRNAIYEKGYNKTRKCKPKYSEVEDLPKMNTRTNLKDLNMWVI